MKRERELWKCSFILFKTGKETVKETLRRDFNLKWRFITSKANIWACFVIGFQIGEVFN